MIQHLKKIIMEGLAAAVVIIALPVLFSCTDTSAPREKKQNQIDPAALVLLKKQKGAAVIDVMSYLECMDHRIPGSRCMPQEELGRRLAESFPKKEQPVVFYCESEECPRGGLAYREAELLGYKDIFVLEGGMAAWKKAGQDVERIRRIKREPVVSIKASKLKSLIEEKKGLFILDVRSEDAFKADHINNAKNIPLYVLHKRLGEIPRNLPLLVVDENGRRSFLVCCYLVDNGITDVTRLFGGMEAVANLKGKRNRP
jgi:hydroxyacylglutathione hydrolase